MTSEDDDHDNLIKVTGRVKGLETKTDYIIASIKWLAGAVLGALVALAKIGWDKIAGGAS